MSRMEYGVVYFCVIVSLFFVFLHYGSKVEVAPDAPPLLTGWQRSVVQDGPAVAARWRQTIERSLAQQRADIPHDLVVGIMLTESMGKPGAKNRSGAAGLLGVKPVVCKALRVRKCDLLNPSENVSLGIRYLQLLKKYGFRDEKLILAYGVGPKRAKEILKKEKPAHHSPYVQKVSYARAYAREKSPNS